MTVERSREENRRILQNSVRSTQVLDFAFELLEARSLVRRKSWARAGVDLGLSNPRPERFRRHAEELADGGERGPLGRVVRAILDRHPHGSFTQLG